MAKILIVNCAEPGSREFVIPLEEIAGGAGASFSTREYRETRDMDLTRIDGAILSGSPRGDDIVEHHQPYFQWIKTFERPVLGICAGHHVIGWMYGSRLLRSEEKEVGDYLIVIDRMDPLFDGLGSRFLARQNHHDSITLPGDFLLLAHSGTCRVQAIKHVSHPLYSTQFHPEILNPRLVANFTGIIENYAGEEK